MTVALYRLARRFGYYRSRLPIGTSLRGPFFSESVAEASGSSTLRYFSHHDLSVSSPPDWFVNPFNGVRCPDSDRHWSEISDFTPGLGDIKAVWEASRFDWVPRMAWAHRGGDESALAVLEMWLRDWVARNPANLGVNWKCGQEASFRCLNLVAAALTIDSLARPPMPGLLRLLETHLHRIAATVRYAMAQDNNHGVSEAAALFVSGHYLVLYGDESQQEHGKQWAQQGRCWLENRVERLILSDGSFSQHSVTYHRLVLDLLSFVELFRSRLKTREFSPSWYKRAGLAATWLHRMIDTRTGDAPNLGANDGSYLFNLAGSPYRDFRPSVQLGASVFLERSAWPGSVRHPLLDLFDHDLLGLPPLGDPASALMAEGGYACLRTGSGFAMLRLPVYRFRPSHADALHLDLWHQGVNWVRDAGSYSYNADAAILEYFPGTASHSTACFDGRDQMPKLGRFLFGAWLSADEVEWDDKELFVRSGYNDYRGARHRREVRSSPDGWSVVDYLSGFENEAVILWHMSPSDWRLADRVLACEEMKVMVESDSGVTLSLIELPESRYYFKRQVVPVLKVRCATPGVVRTSFLFANRS